MQLELTYKNIDIKKLQIDYAMFFESEKNHKLLINIKDSNQQIILDTKQRSYAFTHSFMTEKERFQLFIVEGIEHILDGTDHILFLLMLILPIVIEKKSLLSLIIIATSFSIAHSITLFIAAMHLYTPNTSFIESGIALSIVVVALLNLFGKYKHVNYKLAFLFGLLHGFGFANVLQIAGVDSHFSFIVALLGFNLGVEAGQIAIIIFTVPLLYILQKSTLHTLINKIVISTTLCIALIWFFQRVDLL